MQPNAGNIHTVKAFFNFFLDLLQPNAGNIHTVKAFINFFLDLLESLAGSVYSLGLFSMVISTGNFQRVCLITNELVFQA